MAFHLEGEEEFDRPPAEGWRWLTDPQFLCDCFPDAESVVQADERSGVVRVRPSFSFMRGTLDISFEFVEKEPPTRTRVRVHVKGIASSAEADAQLHLAPHGGGTRLRWVVDVGEMKGLLKTVSWGLTQAAAQKVAADTWTKIRKCLPQS